MRPVNKRKRQENSLFKISAINPGIADKLIERGLTTINRLRTASDEELLAVLGINQGKLDAIRAYPDQP